MPWHSSSRHLCSSFAKDSARTAVSTQVKVRFMTSIGLGAVLAAGCAQQQVAESVAGHAMVEGRRYADEVKAQSPFETVQLQWSEAESLMEKRNPDFLAARAEYHAALDQKPVVRELTDEVAAAVDLSFDVLKPDVLLESFRTPAMQLPRQLASLGKLKDLSHSIEQNAWENTARTVDAEMRMRKEKVELHRLLRLGELIDDELERVTAAPPPPSDADPKLTSAIDAWRVKLRDERKKWLGDVRNFFDAEYHDVRFVKDEAGLPTYQDTVRPDLTEWKRWCRLRRSQELVDVLKKAHESSKPAIPGTRLVKSTLSEIVHPDEPAIAPTLDQESVRKEVRELIQHWREMKQAQVTADGLENADPQPAFDDIARVNRRQEIFKLRQQEIQHAGEVWIADELCWR